jgi:hypothetical protein
MYRVGLISPDSLAVRRYVYFVVVASDDVDGTETVNNCVIDRSVLRTT